MKARLPRPLEILNSEPWDEDIQFNVDGVPYSWPDDASAELGLRPIKTPNASATLQLNLGNGLVWVNPSRLGIRGSEAQMETVGPGVYDLEIKIQNKTRIQGQVIVSDGIL